MLGGAGGDRTGTNNIVERPLDIERSKHRPVVDQRQSGLKP
jgi:hypothetical protein